MAGVKYDSDKQL